MLCRVCHTKIKTHLIQERRRWQLDSFGLEISCHVKHQTIGALAEADMVVQKTVGISTIGIQCEAFYQRSMLTLGGIQVNEHARRWAAMHGVQDVRTQTHEIPSLFG